VVFITQGVLANFDFNQLVNPALVGLAEEGVHLMVTAGGSMANTIVAPAKIIVETYIPYDLVLPKTSVFVTNGCYNGVQQALSYGVPVVSAGISEDKSTGKLEWRWYRPENQHPVTGADPRFGPADIERSELPRARPEHRREHSEDGRSKDDC
jgi:hypothetical protein